MGVVAEVERKLAKKRCRLEADGMPELRTSTMTHIVWAPPMWVSQREARAGGARGAAPVPHDPPRAAADGRRSSVEADATVRDFELPGGREVLSEVIELRLRGEAANHPASRRPAASDLRPAGVLPLARPAGLELARARGARRRLRPARRPLRRVARRAVRLRAARAPVRRSRPSRHRLAPLAAVARAARGALAGDPLDRAADRRGAEGRRPAPRRLAPLAPPARRRADADAPPTRHVDPGRRRSGRGAARRAAVRERPPSAELDTLVRDRSTRRRRRPPAARSPRPPRAARGGGARSRRSRCRRRRGARRRSR